MRFRVTVRKLNVMDRQTDRRMDGGHCNIARSGPSASWQITRELNNHQFFIAFAGRCTQSGTHQWGSKWYPSMRIKVVPINEDQSGTHQWGSKWYPSMRIKVVPINEDPWRKYKLKTTSGRGYMEVTIWIWNPKYAKNILQTGPILLPSYPLTNINLHIKYGSNPIRTF